MENYLEHLVCLFRGINKGSELKEFRRLTNGLGFTGLRECMTKNFLTKSSHSQGGGGALTKDTSGLKGRARSSLLKYKILTYKNVANSSAMVFWSCVGVTVHAEPPPPPPRPHLHVFWCTRTFLGFWVSPARRRFH